MSRSSVLLFSGGLDSLCTWFITGRPRVLHCVLGVDYSGKELHAVRRLADRLGMELIVDYSYCLEDWQQGDVDATVPMRNLLLAMAAARLPKVSEVWLAIQKGEMGLPDRTPLFFQKASSLVSYLLARPVHIYSPIAHLTKVQLVAEALKRGARPEDLLATVSCYSAEEGHCGVCKACARKAMAFKLNDIAWPPGYFATPIELSPVWAAYRENLDNYEGERRRELEEMLAWVATKV